MIVERPSTQSRRASRRLAVLSGLSLLLLAALSAGPRAASDQSKWYAGAKLEGSVVFYTSEPQALQDAMKAAFEKRYPGVVLNARSNQPNTETREKILAAFAARKTSIDVWQSGFTSGSVLLASGALETYQSPDVALVVTPKLSAPFNPILATFVTLAVNTNIVRAGEEPKTWTDILNPKWKGLIASDDPRTGGNALQLFAGLHNTYGEPFLRTLAKQNLFFASQPGVLQSGLARGEFAMVTLGLGQYLQMKAAGAPVRFLRMTDGVGFSPSILYHLKGAPHPNAAKLFIDWALSEEGQRLLASLDRVPVRKGIKAVNPEATLEGLRFFPSLDTPDMLQKARERNKLYDEIFFKR